MNFRHTNPWKGYLRTPLRVCCTVSGAMHLIQRMDSWLAVIELTGASLAVVVTGLRGDVRSEWDEVKQHDVLFLITIRPPTARQLAQLRSRDEPPSVMEVAGLVTVRGAEVIEVKDEGARSSCRWKHK